MNNNDYIEPRPGTPIDETETDLCRALWLAVAVQAVIDATSNSRKKSAIRDKSNALMWLAENADGESDFSTVCDLADIEPENLRKIFKEIRHDPTRSLDFRCLKKMENGKRSCESRKRYFARVRRNDRLRRERPIKETFNVNRITARSACPVVEEYKTPYLIWAS
jgi:hypothetical protein